MPSPLVSHPGSRFRTRESLTAATALAAVIAPSLLKAQIVWSGVLNTNVNSGTTQALLDFNKNSSADAPEAYLTFSSMKGDNFISVSGITSDKTDPTIAFLYNDTPVSAGATIDSSGTYYGSHTASLIPAADTNYYYAIAYQAAGGPYYGWMQLSRNADSSTGTLIQWAYNSVSGAAVTAGQTSAVPEPAATSALIGCAATAAVGLAWWRKRRRRASSA